MARAKAECVLCLRMRAMDKLERKPNVGYVCKDHHGCELEIHRIADKQLRRMGIRK